MSFVRRCVLPTIFALLLVSSLVSRAQATPETKAEASDTVWLALVDAAKYKESWQTAATTFRNAISEDQWTQAVAGVRTPLGKVVARRLQSAKYTKTLPGAPDGEYVVSVFATHFEKKQDAQETVVARAEGDTWRTAGYFVK